jgi:hypothetical protein
MGENKLEQLQAARRAEGVRRAEVQKEKILAG